MAVEIEVDPHAVAESEGTPAGEVTVQPEELPPAPLGWTPEQAAQFVCSIWNIGCMLYGPNWAAHPQEVQGWDLYCAQLLDQVLPRGMGGAVELGVGLVMIGNGLAMMTMRRWPIIKAGPRPIWVREQATPGDQPAEPSPIPPPPAPSANGQKPGSNYTNPYLRPLAEGTPEGPLPI